MLDREAGAGPRGACVLSYLVENADLYCPGYGGCSEASIPQWGRGGGIGIMTYFAS